MLWTGEPTPLKLYLPLAVTYRGVGLNEYRDNMRDSPDLYCSERQFSPQLYILLIRDKTSALRVYWM